MAKMKEYLLDRYIAETMTPDPNDLTTPCDYCGVGVGEECLSDCELLTKGKK